VAVFKTKICFEALRPEGFTELARLTEDDRLLLAPGITPDDLPGRQGALIRRRLGSGEIRLGQAA
jgi:hypothetical protein